MITLYDFQELDLTNRANAVWKGTFLGDRLIGDLTVQLFYLGNFYAEVYYHRVSNQIIAIEGFKKTIGLEPYLKFIKI